MSQLLLAVYQSQDTAEHVLGVLQALDDELAASLESAAVVRLRSDDQFSLVRPQQSRSSGWFWGVFWEALFGLLFRAPDQRQPAGSNLGRLFDAIERAGLDESFRSQVRGVLRRGSSALGIFALNWNTEKVIDQLGLRPDTLIRAELAPEYDAELLRELGRHSYDVRNHPMWVVRPARG